MLLRRIATVIVAGCLTGLVGCGPGGSPSTFTTGRLRVVVSLPPQAWLIERLAGDRAQVDVILPPATSPETWAPTPAAMMTVGDADLYFAVGGASLAFEDRLLAQATAGGAMTTVFVAPAAPGAGADPHPWLELDAVRTTSGRLVERLEELDPGAGALFRENRQQLVLEIAALDRRLGDLLADRRRDVVVVQHPAWGRLLARYGIEEVPIERDGKEPGPSALVAVVELARREQVPVIFSQQGLSPRSARLVSEAVGARIEALDPLARDWPAALERAVTALGEALR